jgi:hypothetical protein
MGGRKMKNEILKAFYFISIALIITTGIYMSTNLVVEGIENIKSDETITVTGSYKQQITSDVVVWSGNFTAYSEYLTDAYTSMEVNKGLIEKYFIEKGISSNEIVFYPIFTNQIHEYLPNGVYSNNIVGYELSQRIEIKSSNVDLVTEITRNSTELINQGINFMSWDPQYYYSKIGEEKVELLGLATKDAMERAKSIVTNTGKTLGELKEAKMGVFQITPPYSTEVSDYGINDTSSIIKEITAVVTCKFEIE